MVFLQRFMVCTWSMVVAVHPCFADDFDEVMVSLLVFCQQNEMPAAFVYSIVFLQVKIALGAINFAAENGLKLFFFRLPFVDFIAVVEEFFDAEHVAVVGYSHAFHSIFDCFVNEFWNGGLSVKNAVLGVYVEVYEFFHFI